jgi:hypothetical protein
VGVPGKIVVINDNFLDIEPQLWGLDLDERNAELSALADGIPDIDQL